MIAVFVSHFANTSLESVERWSPDKLLAYFDTAVELHKIMRQ